MEDSIRLYYHDGYYNKKNPFATTKNLVQFGKLHHPVYNIGDQISPVIVAGLAGRAVNYAAPFSHGKLIAIGSVIAAVKPGDLVWGAGLMKEEHARFVAKYANVSIRAVRGPETQRALEAIGVECPKVFGDPALLMPLIFPSKRTNRYRLGVIPHISQVAQVQALFAGLDVLVISPRLPWTSFIDKICRCGGIVSSSLHGVILADAYGVPAIPMVHGGWLHGTPFKFLDYYHSTNREPQFVESSKAVDLDFVAQELDRMARPDIDLRPLLRAFPYLDLEPDYEGVLSAQREVSLAGTPAADTE